MMLKASFFSDALLDNPAAIVIRAEAIVVAAAGQRAVVPCRHLDVEELARLGRCKIEPAKDPPAESFRYWGGEDHDRLYTNYQQVVWQVSWHGESLQVIHLQWENACGGDSRDWVVGDSVEIAESFILDVERSTHAPGDAILVFSDGRWRRSHDLYNATQQASFDDLVLAGDMKDEIRGDFSQFLNSEDRYQRLGIAWRRGALMIGPPGNGKTHCVRALVKELGVSSLYVQSLSHRYYTAEQLWQHVFDRARGLTPCVLVLEDLDSLVNDENRSFFLNQLDGFEQNHGMIVLATTNYPDRIDAAIIDRPSRFDRKYHFNLPTLDERGEYLTSWQQQLADETGWRPDEVQTIALGTDGFSFAYLKELVISAVMKWMQDDCSNFETVTMDQVSVLQRQMRTEMSRPPKPNGRKRRRSQRV
ncbi:MAG: ATP-binding protein [Pirellulales bacterium]|nr:ATP-binding protein [Pirellulales bacterium]